MEKAILIAVARADLILCRALRLLPAIMLIAGVIFIARRFFKHVG